FFDVYFSLLQLSTEELHFERMISSIYVFGFVFCLVCYLFRWKSRPKNFPPGPLGIPMLGVAPFAGSKLENYLASFYKKYGGVMSFRLGPKDWVVLNDLEAITQAFTKQGESFSGRPKSVVFDQLTQGCGIVFANGDRWQHQRRFVLTALKRLGMGKRTMDAIINEETNRFIASVQLAGGTVSILVCKIRRLQANNTCNFLSGKHFDYKDKRLQAIIDHSTEQVIGISSISPAKLYTATLYAIVCKYARSDNMNFVVFSWCKLYFADIISQIAENHKQSLDENNLCDFIDIFLSDMKKQKGDFFTKLQLCHLIRDLFVGGIDTTTAALGWGIVCLLNFPECQDKIHQEIDQIIGKLNYAVPNMSHQEKMPYLRAFIQEVHRFQTIAGLNIPHCVTEDCILYGYRIPKGTPVMSNIWFVHNDPAHWQEPQKFRPERHLDGDGKFIPSNRVIPFSVGHRSCLGVQLAKAELFLFYAGVLKHHEFQVDPNFGLPDWSRDDGGTLKTPKDFTVCIKER
uniref:Uncharacterized protein n=1 Tax=Ciona savignyi TaxID=51511 RepID=H2YXA2_CIOSA